MKKFLSGLIVGMILMCSIPSLAKTDTVQAIYNGVKVAVNGENVEFKKGEEPVTINDRTYVLAKYVAEALGATVKWDGKNSTVNIRSKEESGTSTMNTSKIYTRENLNFLMIDNEEYVQANSITSLYRDKGFGLSFNSSKEIYEFVYDLQNPKILIDIIEYKIEYGRSWIQSKIYYEQIVPLIK